MKKINNNLYSFQFQKNLVIISAFSIMLGGLIYVLLRPSIPEFFRLFSSIGLFEWLLSQREHTLNIGHLFPDWIVYSLPSGLWAFSYSLLIIGIWSKNTSILKYVWLTTIPLLVFGFEFLQYSGIVGGTFSVGDLIAGLAGMIGGLLTSKFIYNEKTTN